LSPEWFDELGEDELEVSAAARSADPVDAPDLVVGVAVTAAPGASGGEVRYQVAVKGPRAVVLTGPDACRTAQVVLSADYATLAGVASGQISPLDAMSSGWARITGNTSALSAHQSVLEALDLVPPSVRASTSF
jgi:hypothetical protein